MWNFVKWLNSDMIVVPIHYTRLLDFIVLPLDMISMVTVLLRLFAFDAVKGAVWYRIALSFMVIAIGIQMSFIVARETGHPLDPDFQSGWAMKDFAIFTYVMVVTMRERKARHINPHNVTAAADFPKPTEDK